MSVRTRALSFVALLATLAAAAPSTRSNAAPSPFTPAQSTVDILRDVHHVPHVYAPTDYGAFFGMGYATAEDRLFQMEFGRRVMRGTLSEILDPGLYPKALMIDKRARYLGWAQHAADVARGVRAADPTAFHSLRSYAAGVNKRLVELRISGQWPPMFATLGLTDMANWTVADCLLSWWRIQQIFEGPISAELSAELQQAGVCPPPQLIDPTGAVVQQGWSMPLCLEDLCEEKFPLLGSGPMDFMKASHNLAVHGSKTLSGFPLMLAKPQFDVFAPNVFYEIDVHGPTLASRGVAFPGCPAFLVGWNEHIAWSFTSMGGDMRDLYRLAIPALPANSYTLDGQTVAMTDVRTETIHVLGQPDVIVTHRKSVWGPVVTDYVHDELPGLPANPGEGWAYRSVVLDDADKHSLRALIGLMRASNWCEARTAMREWRGPGAHWLYAGDDGHIGYTAAVPLPVRPANATCEGQFPLDGSLSASDWLPEVPFDNLPWDLDPTRGFLSTANNLSAVPEAAWDNAQLGPHGDTARSWRLREYLSRLVVSVAVASSDLQALDTDAVDPVMRVAGRLADHAFGAGYSFSPNSLAYAQILANWSCDVPAGGCWELSTSHPDYAELWQINGKLGRIGPNPLLASLVTAFGDGGAGVCNMLKTAEGMGIASFVSAYPASLTWLDFKLREAAASTLPVPHPFTLGYHDNLQVDLYGPQQSGLHGAGPFQVSLDNIFAGTVWSQKGESYVFLADLAWFDGNFALCPPGVSEDPANPSFFAHVAPWQAGMLYSAPITRTAVEAQGAFTVNTITMP